MIDKIGYTPPPLTARNAASVRRAGNGGAFSEALSKAEGGDTPHAAAGLTGVMGTHALIGLQEVDEREHRRQRATKRGRLTLDALAQLRDGLLMGSLPLSVLYRLEDLVTHERELSMDPALNAILDEIELRAAVELAKLEVAGLIPPRANAE